MEEINSNSNNNNISNLKTLKIVIAISEWVLAIPIVWWTIVLTTAWWILWVLVILHIISLVLSIQNNKSFSWNIIWIITNCIAWFPGIWWIGHIITWIVMLVNIGNDNK